MGLGPGGDALRSSFGVVGKQDNVGETPHCLKQKGYLHRYIRKQRRGPAVVKEGRPRFGFSRRVGGGRERSRTNPCHKAWSRRNLCKRTSRKFKKNFTSKDEKGLPWASAPWKKHWSVLENEEVVKKRMEIQTHRKTSGDMA